MSNFFIEFNEDTRTHEVREYDTNILMGDFYSYEDAIQLLKELDENL